MLFLNEVLSFITLDSGLQIENQFKFLNVMNELLSTGLIIIMGLWVELLPFAVLLLNLDGSYRLKYFFAGSTFIAPRSGHNI